MCVCVCVCIQVVGCTASHVSPVPLCVRVQVRAIFEAAAACHREGLRVQPEIMVPLVGTKEELVDQEQLVRRVASQVGIGWLL